MPIAAIWAVLSKLPWKWIGIGIGVLTLFLLVWRAPWAENRQKAKDQSQITALTADRNGLLANQNTLTAALTQQNAAVAALKADSDKRAKDGATALQQAQKANQSLKDQSANLQRSAALKHAANDPCVASDALAGMGKI